MFINNQRLAQLAGVNYDSEKIRKGPIVYSRTHCVVEQFPELKPCKLITSFSDACVTQDMADKLPEGVTWYSNNVDCHHPRVIAVPIGCVYNVEREKVLEAVIQSSATREHLMYVNFTRAVPRNPNPREGLYEQFGHLPWVTTKGGVSHDSVSAEVFYTDMKQHHYVLSPHGAGPDCHRHWEALLLGCIPIVLKHRANELLSELPCLRVDNWDQVTEKYLFERLPELSSRFNSPMMYTIYFDFWRDLICS